MRNSMHVRAYRPGWGRKCSASHAAAGKGIVTKGSRSYDRCDPSLRSGCQRRRAIPVASEPLRNRQVQSGEASIHLVEGGSPDQPAVLFVHGWPESSAAFERVMLLLSDKAHVLSMDLPGIGGSTPAPASGDKRTLARCVRGVIAALGLQH